VIGTSSNRSSDFPGASGRLPSLRQWLHDERNDEVTAAAPCRTFTGFPGWLGSHPPAKGFEDAGHPSTRRGGAQGGGSFIPGSGGTTNASGARAPKAGPSTRRSGRRQNVGGWSPLTRRPPCWWQAALPFVEQDPEDTPSVRRFAPDQAHRGCIARARVPALALSRRARKGAATCFAAKGHRDGSFRWAKVSAPRAGGRAGDQNPGRRNAPANRRRKYPPTAGTRRCPRDTTC